MKSVLFDQVSAPNRQARLAINEAASWYTWSTEVQSVLRHLDKQRLPTPTLIQVGSRRKYDYSYSLPQWAPRDPTMALEIETLATELFRLKVPKQLILFTGLLGRGIRPETLSVVFACWRDALVRRTGNGRSAFYAPLGTVNSTRSDFPLHSDLYPARNLWNVFDRVSLRGGSSTFLSLGQLDRILLEGGPTLEHVRRRVRHYYSIADGRDHYEQLFRLLYDPELPWTGALRSQIERMRFQIKLHSGQGYLLNDRLWLHGRTVTLERIQKRRVHRLVFDTESDLHSRSERTGGLQTEASRHSRVGPAPPRTAPKEKV